MVSVNSSDVLLNVCTFKTMKEQDVLGNTRKSSYTMEQCVKAIFKSFIVPFLLYCLHIIIKFLLEHNSRTNSSLNRVVAPIKLFATTASYQDRLLNIFLKEQCIF